MGTDGRANCIYGITIHQEQENSLDVVTGMIKVFTYDVYALLDPEVSLSFVTPYVAMNFDVFCEQLFETFSVSTPVGESILGERTYGYYIISINQTSIISDLVELDMIDFDVILGMDWLVDCRPQVVKL